jgi:N-methylhydantoinase B
MKKVVEHGILRGKFNSIVERMGANLRRSGGSRTITNQGDYSCSILDRDGNLVATNNLTHLPAVLETSANIMDRFEFDMREGDVFLHNDPYSGGTHPADFLTFMPVEHRDEIVAHTVVRARVPDFAGETLTSHHPDADTIFQEGYRITPLKIKKEGELDTGLFESIKLNTRVVESERVINSAIAAVEVGERQTLELIDRYGLETVEQSIQNSIEYSNNVLWGRIEDWPQGTFSGQSSISLDDDSIPISVEVDIQEDNLTLEFVNSPDQVRAPLNSPVANTKGYALAPLLCALGGIPLNEAINNNIEIITEPGTLLHPEYPSPISFGKWCTGPAVAEAVTDAIAEVAPDQIGTAMAKQGYLVWHPPTRVYDPDLDAVVAEPLEEEANLIDLSGFVMEGCSGTHHRDGWGVPSYSARGKIAPVEEVERNTPGYINRMEYATDTAGAGKWRGSPSTTIEAEFSADLKFIGYVPQSSPPSFMGGENGSNPSVEINNEDITGLNLRYFQDEFSMRLTGGGGGGYGDPLNRKPEKVLQDYRDGLISIEAAKTEYGVVINSDEQTVDESATTQLRRKRETDKPMEDT